MFEKVEILGVFMRISKYGEQSDCIPSKTDGAKKMKELCVCKKHKTKQ